MGKVKVLLDTNIVLDFFTGRMNDGIAEKLIQIGRSSEFEICISFLTAVNTIYVAKKMRADIKPSDFPTLFTILPQDKEQWDSAESLDIEDFEDALQASCALKNECFITISRDHHFKNAPMIVMSPEHFISVVCES